MATMKKVKIYRVFTTAREVICPRNRRERDRMWERLQPGFTNDFDEKTFEIYPMNVRETESLEQAMLWFSAAAYNEGNVEVSEIGHTAYFSESFIEELTLLVDADFGAPPSGSSWISIADAILDSAVLPLSCNGWNGIELWGRRFAITHGKKGEWTDIESDDDSDQDQE